MSKSPINGNVREIQVSPVRVTYNGVDLGFLVEGTEVNIETQLADIVADAHAKTVLDRVNIGMVGTVKIKIAQLTADKIKAAFPYSTIVTSGPSKALLFGNAVGERDLDRAAALILHPVNKAEADLSGDWKCWLAVPNGSAAITYDAENQIGIEATFNVYPDLSKPESHQFCVYGDPTLGITAAQVGAITFVGTGDGTVGSTSTNDSTTKTETITATCIKKVVGGGKFEVIGSISGAMGVALVGSQFYSRSANPSQSEISFKISAGLVDFEEGDAFTIPTVAASYA